MIEKKKILVWGTGRSAQLFLKQLENCEVVGFVESNKKKDSYLEIPVFEPQEIKRMEWNILVVASVYADVIKDTIIEHNIDMHKVVLLRHFIHGENTVANLELLKDIVNPSYYGGIVNEIESLLTIPRMQYDQISKGEADKIEEKFVYLRDYVRYRTFELVAQEIITNHIKGAVAEAGVFRGTFARLINRIFPDRKCYLFDTFEGFSQESLAEEIKQGYCSEEFGNLFKDTDEVTVRNSMPNKEQCIIRKGYFPETAAGLEEDYAFVSIDLDIEKLIYEALEYFYPRMTKGGYIFIHEYNYNALFGVKKAVARYEKDYEVLKKVPICDYGGTLVIMK